MEEARKARLAEIECRQRDLAATAWWKIFQSTPQGQDIPSIDDLKKPFGRSIPPTPTISFALENTLVYEGMYGLCPKSMTVTIAKSYAPQWEIEDFYK